MRTATVTIAIATACAVASAATADVTSIGEFTGEHSETFENIGSPGGLPGPATIFGGAGTANDPLANTLILATVVSSSDTDFEPFFPYNGFLMGLVPTGQVVFEFETPVTQFGGFFGSAAFHSGGSILFRDEAGGEIDSFDFNVTAMEWGWQGWQSDTPIASIEIDASANPGAPLVFDELQITPIPAPGAIALLMLGAAVQRRRRA